MLADLPLYTFLCQDIALEDLPVQPIRCIKSGVPICLAQCRWPVLLQECALKLCADAPQGVKPFVLIDGNFTPPGLSSVDAQCVVGGDGSEYCIAAASIIAKVTRDRIMVSDETNISPNTERALVIRQGMYFHHPQDMKSRWHFMLLRTRPPSFSDEEQLSAKLCILVSLCRPQLAIGFKQVTRQCSYKKGLHKRRIPRLIPWQMEYGKQWPVFGFDKHKGYGTQAHRDAIREHGVVEIHRRSFLKKMEAERGTELPRYKA